MSERFSVEVEQVYGVDGYCQYKECYGGISMTVTDRLTDKDIAEIDDEEAFMYSGYHKRIWMSDLDEVVGDVMTQVKVSSTLKIEENEWTNDPLLIEELKFQSVPDEIVNILVGYSETQLEALELEVRTVIKTAIMVEALGAWYTEPDYVSGWDEVSVAV